MDEIAIQEATEILDDMLIRAGMAAKQNYRVPELVQLFEINKKALYKEIAAGNLAAIRVSASLRVPHRSLIQYVAEHHTLYGVAS